MMKRVFSLLLTVVMLFALVPSAIADYDYFLTYPEVGGKFDFDYTLAEAAPAEVCNYFEGLIAADTPDSEYEYMNLGGFYLVDDTFTFSAETGGSIYGYYVPEWTSSGEHIHIKDYHLMAAVRDKASGEIISVENWGRHIQSIEEFVDKKLTLPDFYDYDRHEVIFFRYALDFYPDRDYTTPAAVPEVYVSWVTAVDAQGYIYGDANKDHKVSLADVSIMLKYLARWESVGIEVSPYIDEDSERNCFYNIQDVARVLRMIAGYESVSANRYNLVCTSAAKYYYK